MKGKTIRRVFILGAGFSAQAGMPMANELTSKLLTKSKEESAEEFGPWADQLLRRLEYYNSDEKSSGINFEQFFEFARLDIIQYRMSQQHCPVSRNMGQTPFNFSEKITAWLQYMEEDLGALLIDEQSHAKLESMKNFAKQLQDDDIVITFNYDTLLEGALTGIGKSWNHGLMDTEDGGVAILKMHGSLDWWMIDRSVELRNACKIFVKNDDNEKDGNGLSGQEKDEQEYRVILWRVDSLMKSSELLDADLLTFEHQRGWAGLGMHKPLDQLVGSGRIWARALKALNNSEEIFAIGFSFSPYDLMAKFYFSTSIRDRSSAPATIKVIDPSSDDLKFIENVSTVLGPFESIPKRAEDVDWKKLLN